MVWVIILEKVIEGKVVSRRKVMAFMRFENIECLEDLGLRLEDGKALLEEIQNMLVTQQFEWDHQARAQCSCCGKRRNIKDYRTRHFDTVFGRVSASRSRFECVYSGCSEGTEHAPKGLHGRSTPEFDTLRAKLSALLPYRVARNLLCELLSVSDGVAHTTFRNHTFAVAEQIECNLSERPLSTAAPSATSLTLGLDTAYIRALPGVLST